MRMPGVLHGCISLQAVVYPTVDVADRLGDQHVPSISPPNEDVVQQLPAPRAELHRGCILKCRRRAESDDRQETMFCAGFLKEEAVVTADAKSVGTRHFPGSLICPEADMEGTKDNRFARPLHSRQEGIQVVV
nr:unnamed protein product [Spirometra erinaceieuropaei]